MSQVAETVAQLTIGNGQTVSNSLGSLLARGSLRAATSFARNVTITLPQGLAETVQIQVSPIRNPGSTDWVIDQTVTITAGITAGGGIAQLDDVAFKDLRIVATSAVSGQRLFNILARLNLPND